MNKPHATLRPGTNIALIALWALLVAIFSTLSDSPPLMPVAIGVLLGVIAGYVQNMSFREVREGLLDTSTLMEVRRKLKQTQWGRRYFVILWGSGIVLIVVSFVTSSNPIFAFPAAYFGLMLAREVVTLRATLELSHLQANS